MFAKWLQQDSNAMCRFFFRWSVVQCLQNDYNKIAMRCVDFFGCDDLLYNVCKMITTRLQQDRNAMRRFFFRWSVVQCLQNDYKKIEMRCVEFFGWDDLLYNVYKMITTRLQQDRNAKCRFFRMRWSVVQCCKNDYNKIAMRCVDFLSDDLLYNVCKMITTSIVASKNCAISGPPT